MTYKNNKVVLRMSPANSRQARDAVNWANNRRGGTIILPMGRKWNEDLAKAAVDIAKKLNVGCKLILTSGQKEMTVERKHSVKDIRKHLEL